MSCSIYIHLYHSSAREKTHTCHEPDRNVKEKYRAAGKGTHDPPTNLTMLKPQMTKLSPAPTRANCLSKQAYPPKIPKHDSLGSARAASHSRPGD